MVTASLDRESLRLLRACAPTLDALGITAENVTGVDPTLGRNVSGVITHPGGKVFVKAIQGADGLQRFHRTLSFFNNDIKPSSPFRTPALLSSDENTLSAAYGCLPDAADFAVHVRENRATQNQLACAARTVAALHSTPLTEQGSISRDVPHLPPHGPNAIGLALLEESTFGELELWRLLQSDEPLRTALSALVWGDHEVRHIHGDLRSDQLVLDEDTCWLLDWEEFRIGDPARDLGSLAGEILYHRLRTLLTQARAQVGDALTDAGILRTGEQLIAEARPCVAALWRSYRDALVGLDDNDLPDRVAAYMGWFLFDRALASATYSGRLNAFDRALAGIGRGLVLEPATYRNSVGITDPEGRKIIFRRWQDRRRSLRRSGWRTGRWSSTGTRSARSTPTTRRCS